MSEKSVVCGVEHAKWLDNGVRRFLHNPRTLFGTYVKPGDCAIDIGCGPGVFTEGLAGLIGATGKVIAVDLQQAMLDLAREKIVASNMTDRVEFHRCSGDTLGLSVQADFILTFYMVHETPQPLHLIDEIYALLKPGGHYFLAEPKWHVSKATCQKFIDHCLKWGLSVVEDTGIFSRIVVFKRPA
jgi:ubiquinone/menaquinone biosynthesis C-methylase UbiE